MMNNVNKLKLINNNNNLTANSNMAFAYKVSPAKSWCNIVRVNDTFDLTETYRDICQNHHHDSKWILMINPEHDSLEKLSTMGKINPNKILKVNASKVQVSLAHIKNTLLKGTCSAIILSNAHYSEAQLNEISRCAALGKTHCIFLQSSFQKQQLH
ncbi:hypothetical protein SAMN05216262_10881 [Colwellia chukchiensis]|uniref:Cell division inhibitor SulA n=1 Tax=Colwellia chukchiensis TaxID=641665 RepID=A0A1H7NUL1_9GAMM|nr:hypothetical protein [Colwellia chukchiensis]SEL26675.1 hypothetical protein SAMN05216262_10881 [Colwellia chukchiensis]